MNTDIYSIITGTGSYIPERRIPNSAFSDHIFLDENGNKYDRSNEEIIQKFEAITGIKERRYVNDNLLTSDIAALAAEKSIKSANINPESLDYLIVAHNFGDIRADNVKVDMVPSLASRVKQKLDIKNPFCVAYDLPFGCPGWLQGMIQANNFIKTGEAKRALVIGSETLSRVCDPHDRDSMIYADGAGAAILEARKSTEPVGIISYMARTDANPQAYYLTMGTSNNSQSDDTLYLKMKGRKLYEYALKHVPGVIKSSLDKAGLTINDVSKFLIHQANAKMDEAILQRTFKLYGEAAAPAPMAPMTISWLGNSSVATVPTLLDLTLCNKIDSHEINHSDYLVFASVGAGMNINSIVYKVPLG
jgi:3-oxoacyl-[acyl-carrier-protein] synthase-3